MFQVPEFSMYTIIKVTNIKTTIVYHITGKRFVGITPDGQRLMVDGEKVAKTGMNPMEVLLNALGACSAFDIVEMLRKRRLQINSYHIELRGERAEGIPAYYTHIHAKHIFDVTDLEQKTAERFVDLSMNKYCSVVASLKSEISFEVELKQKSA